MKLTGVQDSKYNLDVVARYGAGEENDTRGEIVDIGSTDGKRNPRGLFVHADRTSVQSIVVTTKKKKNTKKRAPFYVCVK